MIERDQMEEWFPDDDIVTVPESVLPEGLTNTPARELLTEVGLPEAVLDVVELDTRITKGIPRVEEIYRDEGERAPKGTGDLFYLGFAGEPFLCLDGGTGVVCQVHQEFGARPLTSSLESFVRVLGFVSQEIQKHQRKRRTSEEQFAERLRDRTLKHLRQTDPKVSAEAEASWRQLLDNIAATAA